MKKISCHKLIILFLLITFLPANSFAQSELITPLNERIYLLRQDKSNMVLFSGDDFSILLNSEHSPITGNVLDKVAYITENPIKFIIYSHSHHKNEKTFFNFGIEDAILVLQENNLNSIIKSQDTDSLESNAISLSNGFP